MKEIKAIVYTSNAGHTKAFAEMLSEELKLPAYDLKNSKSLAAGTEIFYMGWLMAGSVKGLKKAQKKFAVKGICGVGMAKNGQQIEDIQKVNSVEEGTAVFSIQGGFEMEKLSGIYKFMMTAMKNVMGKSIESKTIKSDDEVEMLDMLKNGKNLVVRENIVEIIDWFNS